jgi:predicted GH43/DUF377 family glycosyl hydrolase
MALSFSVRDKARLQVAMPAAMRDFFTLSPFVTKLRDEYSLLLRVVNPSSDPTKKVARIHPASGVDGLHFTLSAQPSLAPGPGSEDRDGCEDPTVAIVDDEWHVYYTGWNQQLERGELMYASGLDATRLVKRGVAIASGHPYTNPKEATIVCGDDGMWNLFFEYASNNRSQIGLAKADSPAGPWRVVRGNVIEQRPGLWDNWHLSPGPIFKVDGQQLMFYNGATSDPKWRIGWVAFDGSFDALTARGDAPLIVPSAPKSGETDIAFAASLVECDEGLWLYYSVADRYLYRSTVAWES